MDEKDPREALINKVEDWAAENRGDFVEAGRLMRLGLWAEKHAVPALGVYADDDIEWGDSFVDHGCAAKEALAALPKEKA
jgi:hypothetical protein